MDVFTTQLTKVRQTTIKPSQLKVKPLKKEGQTRSLDEEKDHLIGESDDYVENNHQSALTDEKNPTYENPHLTKKLTDKKDALRHSEENSNDPPEHLDLYI